METGLNASHMTCPHFELFEGNQAFNIDGDDTWGGAVYNTFFRNHATGKRRSYADTRQPARHRPDVRPLLLQLRRQRPGHRGPGPRALRRLRLRGRLSVGGRSRSGCGGSATRRRTGRRRPTRGWSAPRTGTGTSTTRRARSTGQRGSTGRCPDSLYLTSKPAFFGSHPWPWVDPTGGCRPGPATTLPAQGALRRGDGPSRPDRWANGRGHVQALPHLDRASCRSSSGM